MTWCLCSPLPAQLLYFLCFVFLIVDVKKIAGAELRILEWCKVQFWKRREGRGFGASSALGSYIFVSSVLRH